MCRADLFSSVLRSLASISIDLFVHFYSAVSSLDLALACFADNSLKQLKYILFHFCLQSKKRLKLQKQLEKFQCIQHDNLCTSCSVSFISNYLLNFSLSSIFGWNGSLKALFISPCEGSFWCLEPFNLIQMWETARDERAVTSASSFLLSSILPVLL